LLLFEEFRRENEIGIGSERRECNVGGGEGDGDGADVESVREGRGQDCRLSNKPGIVGRVCVLFDVLYEWSDVMCMNT